MQGLELREYEERVWPSALTKDQLGALDRARVDVSPTTDPDGAYLLKTAVHRMSLTRMRSAGQGGRSDVCGPSSTWGSWVRMPPEPCRRSATPAWMSTTGRRWN